MLINLEQHEIESSYLLYKELLSPFITEIFGWDESFQRQRFYDSYKIGDMFSYRINGANKAFICRSIYSDSVHLHLLLVPKKYQNNGVGKNVMSLLHLEANKMDKDITLSSFKSNNIAFDFYKSLGYYSYYDEQDFFNLKKLSSKK